MNFQTGWPHWACCDSWADVCCTLEVVWASP